MSYEYSFLISNPYQIPKQNHRGQDYENKCFLKIFHNLEYVPKLRYEAHAKQGWSNAHL